MKTCCFSFLWVLALLSSYAQGVGYVEDDTVNLTGKPFSFFTLEKLPLKVDWAPYMPPVGNQGIQSSCVSWVVGYELLGFLQTKRQTKWKVQKSDFSLMNQIFGSDVPDASQVYSSAFIYNLHQLTFGNSDCYNGMEFIEAFSLYNTYGCPRYEDYPYLKDECNYSIPKKVMQKAFYQPNRLVYNAVPIKQERDKSSIKDQIKSQLANGRIVVLGIQIDMAFDNQLKKDSVWTPDTNRLTAKHAVICVGYDEKHFKLVNSWGRDFGKGGYFYISQESFQTCPQVFKQAFIAEFVPNNLPKPSYTKLASNKESVHIGEYVENKGIKYQLMAIDEDSSAIFSALSPRLSNHFSFRIRWGETKKMEVGEHTKKMTYYFSYHQQTNRPKESVGVIFDTITIKRKSKIIKSNNFTFSQTINYTRSKFSLDSANKIEERAFFELNKGNLEAAEKLFIDTDNTYPEFRSAYEISNYLRQELRQTPKPTPEDISRIQEKVRLIDMYKRNKPDDNLKKILKTEQY